ncbi:MAG: inositol monophosphatase [Halobacteriaceae archaeon]
MSEDERLVAARTAAREGGAVAGRAFRTGLDVEYKTGKTDTVTVADREAQRRVLAVLAEHFPEEPVVGEEEDAPKAVPESGPAWIVDPIDGTNNFVREIPVWGTAVARVEDGEPVLGVTELPALDDEFVAGPSTGDATSGMTRNGEPVTVSDRDDPESCHVSVLMWWAMDDRAEYAAVLRAAVERFGDVRRLGSAQATLATVAAGGLDGGFTTVVPPAWDTVAGVHMIRRAGGRATDVHGERWAPGADGLVVSNGEIHDDLIAAARDALDPADGAENR